VKRAAAAKLGGAAGGHRKKSGIPGVPGGAGAGCVGVCSKLVLIRWVLQWGGRKMQ
jgi:hypothetical protein